MKTNLKNVPEEELIVELQKRGVLRVLWSKADIKERAKEMDIKLSKKQVDDVASLIESKHDCNVGLSWEVIDIFIDMILNPYIKPKK